MKIRDADTSGTIAMARVFWALQLRLVILLVVLRLVLANFARDLRLARARRPRLEQPHAIGLVRNVAILRAVIHQAALLHGLGLVVGDAAAADEQDG